MTNVTLFGASNLGTNCSAILYFKYNKVQDLVGKKVVKSSIKYQEKDWGKRAEVCQCILMICA